MRGLLKSNHRQRRPRFTPTEYQNKRQLKPIKKKCLSLIQIIKLVSAILVPIMIGAFTLITTFQESKNVQLQQNAEKRRQEADILKIKEQQQRDDINAREIRMQNVYDTFMKEILPIVLKDNSNLTMAEITFARAKSLLTLDQIDSKRKWYLVKFLYDNKLLYAHKRSMKYIDLAMADLSNVKFGAERRFSKQIDLEGILLAKLQLKNSTFENVGLKQANFDNSDLSYSSFIDVSIVAANFTESILENSKFFLFNLEKTSFKNSKLKFSSWSPASSIESLVFTTVDYSNCDLRDSSFEHVIMTSNVRFDQAKLERITFFQMEFRKGAIFNNSNLTMSKFVNIQITNGNFIQCNMIGAIFENIRFKNVIFEHVDLQNSQFNDIPNYGSIHFKYVNLIASNLNFTRDLFRISDSFLPNGTFKTSVLFGINLIKNGDSEQGQCYHFNQSSITTTPQGWSRYGNVSQIYYNNNDDWTINMTNDSTDWKSCFFFGGVTQRLNQSNLYENIIRQEINVEQLSLLINSRRTKFHASAYLGGFENEQSSTSMQIDFNSRPAELKRLVVVVTNLDRQNKTAMLYRFLDGTIPIQTMSISIELKFYRYKSQSGLVFGMADNLKFIIQQQ